MAHGSRANGTTLSTWVPTPWNGALRRVPSASFLEAIVLSNSCVTCCQRRRASSALASHKLQRGPVSYLSTE